MAEINWTEWAIALGVLVFGIGVLWFALKATDVYRQIPELQRHKHVAMYEILQKLGIKLDDVPTNITIERLPQISFRCAECDHVVECRLWLSGKLSDTAFRNFCPNAANLEYLQSQRLVA